MEALNCIRLLGEEIKSFLFKFQHSFYFYILLRLKFLRTHIM